MYFNAAKLYAGAVEFTAYRRGESWRIEEFRLPNYGIKTALGEDGNWHKSPLQIDTFDLQYVPTESTWAVGACAAELLKSPAFDKLKTADIFHPELFIVSRANVRQVLWLKFPLGQNPSGGDVVMITVKDDSASDVAELIWQRAAKGEKRTIGGRTVHEAGEAGMATSFSTSIQSRMPILDH